MRQGAVWDSDCFLRGNFSSILPHGGHIFSLHIKGEVSLPSCQRSQKSAEGKSARVQPSSLECD